MSESLLSPAEHQREPLPSEQFTSEEFLTLPEEVRLALCLADMTAMKESFETATELTDALAERSSVEREKLKKLNSSLFLKQDFLDRRGFANSSAVSEDGVRLWLNEKGHNYLQEQLEKLS